MARTRSASVAVAALAAALACGGEPAGPVPSTPRVDYVDGAIEPLLLPLTTQPGYQVLPYECHEGNKALHNILSAARAEDQAVEEAVKKGLPRPKPSLWLGGVAPGAPDQ